MKIKDTGDHGIHVFCRDNTLFSIQFGEYSYTEHYNDIPRTKESKKCAQVEVAVIRGEEWITNKIFPENGEHENDSIEVYGYAPLKEVFERIIKFENGDTK